MFFLRVASKISAAASSLCRNMPGRRRLHTYDEAIQALSSLISNEKDLEHARAVAAEAAAAANSSSVKTRQRCNIESTIRVLERTGITVSDLDQKLKFIHVAGTKGKGSTCAMTESILRRYGYKTGFYSSPHLVSVTERIRINGVPLSQERFVYHFWPVFNSAVRCASEKISYFKFLTVLAFNVFIKENVDVVVLEVGLGGLQDCTNVIRSPTVCGITSLGLDHTRILGDTIEQIAWNKAGIIKPGVPVFVDNKQDDKAMRVIESKAETVGSEVIVVPDLSDYDWQSYPEVLGLDGTVQRQNASLALQMSRYFRVNAICRNGFSLEPEEVYGLRHCFWPGRFQVLKRTEDLTLYLDSAHTLESIRKCAEWFADLSSKNATNSAKVQRILLFNATRDHDSRKMLDCLKQTLSFDAVVFCTNITSKADDTIITDNTNPSTSLKTMRERCQIHADIWNKDGDKDVVVVIPYLSEALYWATQGLEPNLKSQYGDYRRFASRNLNNNEKEMGNSKVEVLITGSLHLVGGVLDVLQVDLQPPSFDEEDRIVISNQ